MHTIAFLYGNPDTTVHARDALIGNGTKQKKCFWLGGVFVTAGVVRAVESVCEGKSTIRIFAARMSCFTTQTCYITFSNSNLE